MSVPHTVGHHGPAALREDGLAVDQPLKPPLAPTSWSTHPATRLVGFVLVAGAVVGMLYALASLLTPAFRDTWWAPVQAVFLVVPAVVAYWVVARVLERRRPAELDQARLGGLGVGLLLGLVLVSACVGAIWVLGGIRFEGMQTPTDWVRMLTVTGLQAAVLEEIAFRGLLYRFAEEGFGTWASVLVSAVVFGLLHLGNPGATLLTATAIALEAGVLFAALYALTRSLWLVIGLHFAWNMTQWLVFSVPVSGGSSTGWLVTRPSGSDLVSGGAFGIEASLVTTVLLGGVALVVLVRLHREDLAVSPAWTRRSRLRTASPGADTSPGAAQDEVR